MRLDIPPALFEAYEWVEEGHTYREACIPAVLLNDYGPPRRLSAEEVEAAEAVDPRWRLDRVTVSNPVTLVTLVTPGKAFLDVDAL